MSKKWFWISLSGVLAVTTIVYFPSLYHLLRGESYCYLLDTMGHNGVWELIKNFWNYESVRQIAPGDRLLFRPLLFTVLGIEKGLFGGDNHVAWRIVALFFHLTAVVAVFRLLWKFRPGILAFLMATLFGVGFICLGTILYEQIASYALYTALLLTGYYYLYQGTEMGRRRDLIISAVFMLVACFFHETGIIFASLFIAYVFYERNRLGSPWKHWAWAFVGVLAVWSAVYFPSKFIHPVRFLDLEVHNILDWESVPLTLRGIWILASRWFQQALIPAVSQVNSMPQWWSYPIDLVNEIKFNLPFILNCVALLLMAVSYIRSKSEGRARMSFSMLLLASMGMLMVANSLFRARSHGEHYLVDYNFNVYIWMGLFTVLIFIFIASQKLSRKYLVFNALALAILIGLNAPQAFKLNMDIVNYQEQDRAYIRTIDAFVEEHKDEPDLSFNILTEHYFQEELEFLYWRVPDDVVSNFPTHENLEIEYDCFECSVPEIIFSQYWDEMNPKYTLKYHLNPDELEIVNE